MKKRILSLLVIASMSISALGGNALASGGNQVTEQKTNSDTENSATFNEVDTTQLGRYMGTTTVTIPEADWITENGEYKCTIHDKNVQGRVSVLLTAGDSASSADVMREALLRPGSIQADGSYTVYAKNKPKGTIILNVGYWYGESEGKVFGAFLDSVNPTNKLVWRDLPIPTGYVAQGGIAKYSVDSNGVVRMRGIIQKNKGLFQAGDLLIQLPDNIMPYEKKVSFHTTVVGHSSVNGVVHSDALSAMVYSGSDIILKPSRSLPNYSVISVSLDTITYSIDN